MATRNHQPTAAKRIIFKGDRILLSMFDGLEDNEDILKELNVSSWIYCV